MVGLEQDGSDPEGVEITEAMVAAGTDAVREHWLDLWNASDADIIPRTAVAVFRAMSQSQLR
jgi:hypothetical protein